MLGIAKSLIAIGVILFLLSLLSGCSGLSQNLVTSYDKQEVPYCYGISQTTLGDRQHVLWGTYNLKFDLDAEQAVVELLRSADAHYNVTDMLLPPSCDDCVKIKVNSFDTLTRILDVDVTLYNPTTLAGYDVRGILYTDDYGHELRNADDWTALFDIPGGEPRNPFKAFAKDQPKRKFASEASHTEQSLIYIPVPPHYENIKFAVEASFPGNCKEPYSIENFSHEVIYETVDSHGLVAVDVHDWQNDVNKVTLVAPEITGEQFTQLVHQNGDVWVVDLYNKTGVKAGDYQVRIIATSANSGSTALYDYFNLTITQEPVPDLLDVTPPWLNFSPRGIFIDGNRAYIAGGVNGLHIFDITNSVNPVWLHRVETQDYARDVAVAGGYAYVADKSAGLQIINIDPLESAAIFKTVKTPDKAKGVAVAGGYAFIAAGKAGLVIVDTEPLDSASIVKTIDTPGKAKGVAVSGGYAYVADNEGGLQIVDIAQPESAHIVEVYKLPGLTKGVTISNGYAYVTNGKYGLRII